MDREIKLTLGDEDHQDRNIQNIDEIKKDSIKNTEEINLTDEEKKQIDEFAKQIDLKNSNLILQYGAGAQKNIADFSEKTLESVKSKDLGEVGDLLSNVVNELKNFDIDENENGFKKFFKKSANKVTSMQTKYANIESNVDTIVRTLDNHQIQLLKDIAILDQMYDLNESYYKELSMYILAGRKKLEEANNKELPELIEKANRSNLPTDAQKIQDYQSSLNRFDKKLHDLDLTRTISLQMAPQIRMVQSSNTVMVEKIQSTIVNTIPLWKSQMVISLGASHSLQAAKTQKEVTDFTNELLRKNADALNMATVESAKASERSIVDIDTIKHTNEQLISALREVKQIQKDGIEQRKLASNELIKIEEELKSSLMDIARE
ncbi:toxic anion resistance protein [Peptoniphilus stercorisuis]|uniref:Uncharacterized protein YaaN involved in tellurite resistance n=1 Tax=Peptoniphilus stercorisuis TaxID=1436965 RepID=A0ABS4KDZ2_9FIRM|nr:toxic anion resistance protein [Peptoniphilus stercorisuis]MBP2025990.1 uncharacterized protein YaaN involved in tellurite resistance [Peptoniphilus stercorisuis]